MGEKSCCGLREMEENSNQLKLRQEWRKENFSGIKKNPFVVYLYTHLCVSMWLKHNGERGENGKIWYPHYGCHFQIRLREGSFVWTEMKWMEIWILWVERVSVSIHESFDSERLLTMLGLVVWSGRVSIFVITFLPCLRQTSKQSQPWQLSSITNAIKFKSWLCINHFVVGKSDPSRWLLAINVA
jgi:hypothetical protein